VNRLPARPRLEARLDGALAHRLTLLVADAGFGKTTLLSSWSSGINAVVHPVTAGDQDLSRLWRHISSTLRRRLPDLSEVWAAPSRGPVSARSESVRPQAMAELLGQALERHLTEDLVLALDDAHLVAGGPAGAFVAGLVRHAPPLLHVVLASRGPLPVPAARLRTQGQVLELAGAELAFTTGEVAALLAEVIGPDARGLAEEVRAATGGWPIAVRLAVEALREVPAARRADRLARLAVPGGQLDELIAAIYAQEPEPVRRLLAIGAQFGRFTVALCEALGVAGAAGLVAGLARRGLFVEPATDLHSPGLPPALDPVPAPVPAFAPVPAAGSPGRADPDLPTHAGQGGDRAVSTGVAAGVATGLWYRLHPLARRFLTERAPLPAAEASRLRWAAVEWLARHGHPHTALRWLLADPRRDQEEEHLRRVAALLAEAGERLAAGGHADVVVAAVEALPPAYRGPGLDLLAGHAYLVRGDWDQALACYDRVAGDTERLPASLAWRIGMIHYLRGEHDRALATYQRAETGGPDTADTALLLAWSAAAYWIRGDAKNCAELAARALRVATDVDDAAALAAAHTVLSMLAALNGDRRANAARYRQALAYATRAGDVLQLIRIHTNRASHSLEEGDYAPALAELERAIRLADVHGYGTFGGLALTNRAEIRLRLGMLEEAHRDIEAAVAIFEDLGSRSVAYPLGLLGRLHHLRGDDAAAARGYQRALAQIEPTGDQQARVALLAGLARVLAATEPDRAADLAGQAMAGGGIGQVDALLAAARVAAVRSRPAEARRLARLARTTALTRRDRAGVAEAYEVEAAVSEPGQVSDLARQAVARWSEIGDPIGQARAELILAEHLDEAAARATAEAVRERMGTVGCRPVAARAEALLARRAPAVAPRPVRVETLGTFRVWCEGTLLAGAGWGSRKAREVLKILLARRGRPVTREFLMEALWPGQPPAALPNRLHVAVSTLRAALDPERRYGSDAFVATDAETVRLRLDHLAVDVEEFLSDATAGLALLRSGRTAEALPRLTRAESRYAGDFLEEDLYQDWAVPVREQARSAYLSVAAGLARHAEAAGDPDAAARYLLRLLEHDPYDEQAHLRLVRTFAATGRHGEARRHYRNYCARMDELEIEAAPFPTG